MKDALNAKFTQHDALKRLLLGTGNRQLVEHTSNDDYWGDGGDGSGQNLLGKLLMELRDQLREPVKQMPMQPMIQPIYQPMQPMFQPIYQPMPMQPMIQPIYQPMPMQPMIQPPFPYTTPQSREPIKQIPAISSLSPQLSELLNKIDKLIEQKNIIDGLESTIILNKYPEFPEALMPDYSEFEKD